MFHLARLDFATDSTWLITLFPDSSNSPTIDVENVAVTDGYHNLSPHGRNESNPGAAGGLRPLAFASAG